MKIVLVDDPYWLNKRTGAENTFNFIEKAN
jgi:hypothetical protein